MSSMHERTLLTERDLAGMLGKPPRTLSQWRYRQVGPPFLRLVGGSVRYDLADIEAWLDTQRVDLGIEA